MYFNIADFVIEVKGIRKVLLPLSLFRVRRRFRIPDIRISVDGNNSLSRFRRQKLIFKSEFWEICQWQDKIIFWDRFNGARLNQSSRFAVFDQKLTQGKVFYTNCHELHTNRHELNNPLSYPIGALLILNKLSQGRGIFLHASGIKDNNKGYVFCGRSGIGKTTIAKLWQENNRGTVLNDDRIIVRKLSNKFYTYGGPWHTRDNSLISNEKVQINKIFFLKKSRNDFIRKINSKEAFEKIISQAYFAIWEESAIDFSFGFLSDLCRNIPCFELGFRSTPEIIDLIERN